MNYKVSERLRILNMFALHCKLNMTDEDIAVLRTDLIQAPSAAAEKFAFCFPCEHQSFNLADIRFVSSTLAKVTIA